MKRTSFLLVPILLLPWIGSGGASTKPAAKPNVLFIMADDLRNDLPCYGDRQALTPHLDDLAGRSIVFHRAYCQQAVCNPSRASMLTGRRPDELRIWDLPTHFRQVAPDTVTLPQHFKRHGYFTQNVGKIFHNFRQTIQGDPDSWSVPAAMHFASHGSDKAVVEGPLPSNLAGDPKCECRDVPDDAYFDGRVADLAIRALHEAKDRGGPFFLAAGFWKPHAPFNAPKRYWDLYDRASIAMPANPGRPEGAPEIARHDSREILGRGDQRRQLDPAAIREIRHGYLAGISYLDAQVGRVLAELDRLGLAGNTIVVFTSDHGYHLGEQDLWAKTSNYELDARVPLFVATPETTSGGGTRALAELIDLFPTLADLCGLPAPAGTSGTSLVPVLKAPGASVKTAALTQHPRPAYFDQEPSKTPAAMGYSVRTVDFRYIEWRDWSTGETIARELYDHRLDSGETRNLAADPDHAVDLRSCAAALNALQPLVKPGWKPEGILFVR